ncbi:hypothetical protein J5226_12735 [Lysobacter sp. K5869]|uniref:hypothetical protein n=1 Tax=Lysobacter sp. K5869 TaxID=2820808 RepID=UPI001C062C21|nr:hypothetical protein [Lysobacter sp. K5869]QWP79191.1 hypothetical protein J5226_12735 [Lysobacter sp. K5869]
MHDQNYTASEAYAASVAGVSGPRDLGAIQKRAQLGPPRPVSATDSRLGELRESQNETFSLVTELESRLSFVLSPEPEEKTACGGASPGAPSAICNEIDQRLSLQLAIRARLNSILHRLTV